MKIPLSFLYLATLCTISIAHPVPDIPVRSTFGNDGNVVIQVEIDPRCFSDDPLNQPYLQNEQFQSYTPKEKSELLARAKKLIMNTIEFKVEPGGQIRPDFKMHFSTFENAELRWNAEEPDENSVRASRTPVVMTAEWVTDASKSSGYQIKANKAGKFSVQFINYVGKEKQRLNVLFPGEESYVLDLEAWARSVAKEASAKTEKSKE